MKRPRSRLEGSEGKIHAKAKARMARWLGQALGAAGHVVVVEYPFSQWGDGVRAWSACGFQRKPSRQELTAKGMPPFYICDIVVIENGAVSTAVEVVHGHYTPPAKVAWLNQHGIAVYEAHASVILGAKGQPDNLDHFMTEVLP